MKNAVLIDFDDTLCYTNSVFNEVKAEYNELMKSYGLWDSELNAVMNDYDIANVHRLGHFSTSCFPDAFGQAYEHYCRKYNMTYEEEKRRRAVELGYSVFSRPIQLMPDAEWLLQELSTDYRLFLVTHGDIESQRSRVARSGISHYFEQLYLLEKKSREEYQRIITENSLDASMCFMLGNSLRYDVALALEVGLHAIYLISDSWEFDLYDITEGFETVHSLREACALIKEG